MTDKANKKPKPFSVPTLKERETALALLKFKRAFNKAARRKMEEPNAIGAKMADGSVFAGLTHDGKHRIFAMPVDRGLVGKFNDAAKAVEEMNENKTLGHDDWQIPNFKDLQVLYKNMNEGALKGTFKTVVPGDSESDHGSYWPNNYFSSTKDKIFSNLILSVCFSTGYEGCGRIDVHRFSCRPVRLVEAPYP